MPARLCVASAVDREGAIQEFSGKRIAENVPMPRGVPTAIGSPANGTSSGLALGVNEVRYAQLAVAWRMALARFTTWPRPDNRSG